MARYINGREVKTSQDKREAVESQGGAFNEVIEGDFIQGDVVHTDVNYKPYVATPITVTPTEPEVIFESDIDTQGDATINTGGKNYVEKLGGSYIQGNVIKE